MLTADDLAQLPPMAAEATPDIFSSGDGFAAANNPHRLATTTPTDAQPVTLPAATMVATPPIPWAAAAVTAAAPLIPQAALPPLLPTNPRTAAAAAVPQVPNISRAVAPPTNSLPTLTQPSATPALPSTTRCAALPSTTTTPTVDPLPPVVDASVEELLLSLIHI